MEKINMEKLLKFGLPGLLGMLLMYSAPYVIDGWQMNKTENRIDTELNQTAWGRYAQRLEAQLAAVNESLDETNYELAAVKAELRLIRTVDYYAPIAMWEVDRNRRIKWFNLAFCEFVWNPEGIDPEVTYGKRWADLFPADQAKAYTDSDMVVLKDREPMSYDSWSLAQDGSKLHWTVVKWPIIGNDKTLQGIKGVAIRLND